MPGKTRKDLLEDAIGQVKHSRRDVLKKVLIGAGAVAFVAPFSTVTSAQDDPADPDGRGRGKGKGKGKGPDEGRGRGDGKGRGEGKGRGDGRGRGDNPGRGDGKGKGKGKRP